MRRPLPVFHRNCAGCFWIGKKGILARLVYIGLGVTTALAGTRK